jgi:hypothetical protein
MRLPITGHAQGVSDTVQRAMEILKDCKDPATTPSTAARRAALSGAGWPMLDSCSH